MLRTFAILKLFKHCALSAFNLKIGLIEFGQSTDCILHILHTGCLVAGVHTKLRKTDIYRMDADLCIGQIAQCGTACAVAAVCKCLNRYTSFIADIGKYCTAECVRGVFLVRALLDDDTFVHPGAVDCIRLLPVVRVNGVCVVAAYEERTGNCLIVVLRRLAKCAVDAVQDIL